MSISYKDFPISFGDGPKGAEGSGSSAVIFLSADETSNVTTERDVSEFTVVVPPGKVCSLQGLFFFNTVVATTGAYLGFRVQQGVGDGPARGGFFIENSVAATGSASSIVDGDLFNVASGVNAIQLGVLATGATVGASTPCILQAVLKNTSTNANTEFVIRIRSEIAASQITLKAGSLLYYSLS